MALKSTFFKTMFKRLSILFISLCLFHNLRAQLAYGITDPFVGPVNLISFNVSAPGNLLSTVPVSGILAGQTIRAIDFRPSNKQLYALSGVANGGAAQLYTINLITGAATPLGSGFSVPISFGNEISIDFDPVLDALRIITSNGQNYRVNPNTGTLILQDATIGQHFVYSDIAYINNFPGATTATLYTYTYGRNYIGIIGGLGGSPSPNDGAYTDIGSSNLIARDPNVGMDVITQGGNNTAYVSMTDFKNPSTREGLYTVNLNTGACTLVGEFSVAVLDFSITIPEALPVTLASFTALASGCSAVFNWSSASEQNSKIYIIEHSTDGQAFSKSGEVASRNSPTGAAYSFTYNNLDKRLNYFRLRMVDIDGATAYSSVVSVTGDCGPDAMITIAPNPVRSSTTIKGLTAGDLIELYNSVGAQAGRYQSTGSSYDLNLVGLPADTYLVRITTAKGNIKDSKLVKN